jgi:hypothetical protein
MKEKADMLKKYINSARSIKVHVNAVLTSSYIPEKVCRQMQGLFGASDYGPFSSHPLSSLQI